jgi:hypothetical protein
LREKVGKLSAEKVIGKTHHCTFIVALCTLRLGSVPIIPTTFDTVALAAIASISPQGCPSCGDYEDVIESRLPVYTVHLRRDAEQGGT